jgi:hypothetical protein
MSLEDALNKLAKWRGVFASWQLGTRANTDAECQAVRDHREVTILMRAELNAQTQLLIRKGLFTYAEFREQLCTEARILDESYEKKFPGFSTSLAGLHVDVQRAKETTRNWRPC